MTREFAERIWDVITRHAGAKENHTGEKHSFVSYLLEHWETQDIEWRFCGSLGFGGKLYFNNNGLYVNCYAESLTKERNHAIKMTNKELALLMDEMENAR